MMQTSSDSCLSESLYVINLVCNIFSDAFPFHLIFGWERAVFDEAFIALVNKADEFGLFWIKRFF